MGVSGKPKNARRTVRLLAAVPSSDPFHEAARDEIKIASEIWDSARVIHGDTHGD
jgi:hypothetical protein